MRPRWYWPIPSSNTRPPVPVETTGASSWRDPPSMRRPMASLPYSLSTPAIASSRALLRFLSSMGRRLLFFPILRTRSARRVLVGGSVIVLPSLLVLLGAAFGPPAVLSGCENRAPQRDPDPTPVTRPSATPAAVQ